MDRKQNVVTQLQQGKKKKTSKKSDDSKVSQKEQDLAKALLKGLARLLEGQRQFADEFGLSLARVFPQCHQAIEGQTAERTIKDWFKEADGVGKLKKFFEELFQHQLALIGSMDAIALQALHELEPGQIKKACGGWKTDSKAWKTYKDYVSELTTNDRMRYQKIVAPGFIDKYMHAREQVSKKKVKKTKEHKKNGKK